MSQERWCLQVVFPLKGYRVPDVEEIHGSLQANNLFEVGPVRAGCSGLCIRRFEHLQGWKYHSLSGPLLSEHREAVKDCNLQMQPEVAWGCCICLI